MKNNHLKYLYPLLAIQTITLILVISTAQKTSRYLNFLNIYEEVVGKNKRVISELVTDLCDHVDPSYSRQCNLYNGFYVGTYPEASYKRISAHGECNTVDEERVCKMVTEFKVEYLNINSVKLPEIVH